MTILVATDRSPSARAAARSAYELARASGDRIVFVTAWHEHCPDFGMPIDLAFVELVETERDHAATVLGQAKTDAEAAGLAGETLVRHGYPVQEICAVARERNARMIVLGSHGWDTPDGALGSVASGVLRDAPCPVLVVPAPRPSEPAIPRDRPLAAALR